MDPQTLDMIRRMGKAAGTAYIRAIMDGLSPVAVAENAGLAALREMIPATEDFPHLHEFGVCAYACPFRRHYEESGLSCTMRLSILTTEIDHPEIKSMKPGPDCPAEKGEGT